MFGDIMSGWMKGQYGQVVELMAGWVGAAFDAFAPWTQQWAADARAAVVALAFALLTLIIGYDTIRALLSGEEGIGGPALFRRAVQAGVFISMSGWFVPQAATAARALGEHLASSGASYADQLRDWMASMPVTIMASTNDDGTVVFGKMFVLLIAVGLVMWQAKLRAWQLAFLFIMGPVAGLGAARTDDPMTQGMFGTWVKEVLSILGADVIQHLGIGIMVTRIVAINRIVMVTDNSGFWNTVLLGFAVAGLPPMVRGLLSGTPGAAGGGSLVSTIMTGQQIVLGVGRLFRRGG